jgi:hypothetical protein
LAVLATAAVEVLGSAVLATTMVAPREGTLKTKISEMIRNTDINLFTLVLNTETQRGARTIQFYSMSFQIFTSVSNDRG